jgi:hypothetical protein
VSTSPSAAPAPTQAAPPPAGRKRSVGRILAWIAAGVGLILVIFTIGFVVWALQAAQPMPEALAALESDEAVTVAGNNPIVFTPTASAPTCGLIFYAGGRVDERAYAPALRAFAEAGHLVLLPSMPLNLAVLSPGRASGLMEEYPEIERWVIAGHSLGGAMAATYANGHPAEAEGGVHGLSLWAAFPAAGADLSARTDIAVSSVYGSEDGLAVVADIDASRPLLPADTLFARIEGGNHAQFGWYGAQNGDGEATISREDQQAQTVAATLETLAAACEGE